MTAIHVCEAPCYSCEREQRLRARVHNSLVLVLASIPRADAAVLRERLVVTVAPLEPLGLTQTDGSITISVKSARLSDEALVLLVAHELGHLFEARSGGRCADEGAAERHALGWGFPLDLLKREVA